MTLGRFYKSIIITFLFSALAHAGTLEGTVQRRLSGVKHWLSCHCFNGLLLRTKSDTVWPVCLPVDTRLLCNKVKFTGAFREHTSDPETTSPCSRATKKIFFADSVECSEIE